MKFRNICLIALMIFSCSGKLAYAQFFGSPDGDGESSLFFMSSENSFIGQGETVLASPETGFTVQGFVQNTNIIRVFFNGLGLGGGNYSVSFNPLGNLSPGTYSLSRFGANADVAFAFDGNGSAANQTS